MTDQNNAITQAQQEALDSYLPPSGFIFPLRDGQTTTAWNPQIWCSICDRYAQGEPLETVAKSHHIPPSLVWRWASLPGLAPIWAEARKLHAHSMMDKASGVIDSLKSGRFAREVFQNGIFQNGIDAKVDPSGGTMRAMVRAQVEAGRLAMEVAAKIEPDTYSDRLQIDKRQVSAVYVVAYDANQQIGHEPATVDVSAIPAPDKAGVERAKLTQSWRKAIAKERRLKLKQLASTDT